jgi:hypothetical protein
LTKLDAKKDGIKRQKFGVVKRLLQGQLSIGFGQESQFDEKPLLPFVRL